MREITISGKIDSKGNVLINKALLDQFASQYPDSRLAITFEILDDETDLSKFRSWYKLYLVPKFKEAFYELGYCYNNRDAEEEMRFLWPPMLKEGHLRNISDLGLYEMKKYCEYLKMIASMEFSVYIED